AEELRHERIAPLVEPLRLPRGMVGERVGGEQRERDGRVAVADDGVGQAVGVDLAPAHGLARRRAREAARVDARVGELDVVVVPLLLDAEHLLHLRLGLEDEVLGRPAAEYEHARLPARALGPEHDGGGLVHVARDVDLELATLDGERGHVHADRAVARRGGVDGHAELVGRGDERPAGEPERALPLRHHAADQVVELCGAHLVLELGREENLPVEGVGVEQHLVVEDDVVDALVFGVTGGGSIFAPRSSRFISPMGASPVAFPKSISKRGRPLQRARGTGPQVSLREVERESAHVGRRGLGASEQRSARSARAADGPPGVFDGPEASLDGSGVDTLALALATVGGVGRAPVAPGTLGSVVAAAFLPALAALRAGSCAGYAALLLGIVALAVWSAGRAEHMLESRDHSDIVIDEVAGMVLAGLFLPGTWLAVGLAFVLFRI